MTAVIVLAFLVQPALLRSQTSPAAAVTGLALAGQVTSAEEGAMEGVLVSARKVGSTITTTLVTDASGRYAFPANRMEPGQYGVTIRAAGYELAAQLSNAEWMMSMPGTDQEKRALLERMAVDLRAQDTATPDRQEHQAGVARFDPATEKWDVLEIPQEFNRDQAQIDGQGRLWIGEYRGNKITMFDTKTERFQEWTAPTAFSAPYDVVLDKRGLAWTGSMSSDRVLRLDPASGEFTEYQLPRTTNIRRVFVDNRGARPAFWVGNNQGASIVKLETLD